jgi:hypothetical protein
MIAILISTQQESLNSIPWRWISVRQLPEMIVSFKRQVYVAFLREFPHFAEEGLIELFEDPIVRITMRADVVDDRRALTAFFRRLRLTCVGAALNGIDT